MDNYKIITALSIKLDYLCFQKKYTNMLEFYICDGGLKTLWNFVIFTVCPFSLMVTFG